MKFANTKSKIHFVVRGGAQEAINMSGFSCFGEASLLKFL